GVFSIGHWVRRVFYRKTATSGWSSNPNLWPISLSDNSDGGRVVVLRGKTYPLNSSGQAEATQQHHIQRYFYTYNSRGLVSRIRNRFGAYLQFRYDDNDRLIQLTDQAGVSIHYQYDAHGNLTGVIYPDDTPNDLTDNPHKTYVHNDHLGMPRILTDQSQAKVWEVQAAPFGEVSEEVATGITNLKSFPGQMRDLETGYSDSWNRMYDPSIGRYVQSDPIGLQGGINTYGYALQNPTRYT
ncbi:RHS repeat domain-containing protein, partial [Gynuella sp.]|uniref:RHS repeat domain-containing protein n=1 Tax=Gynuella sp. TaxID=2969146 RepID=UPI003D132844